MHTKTELFQYLMKLHYSQTLRRNGWILAKFQYLMKLHYSQTYFSTASLIRLVSVPYEITLLSN